MIKIEKKFHRNFLEGFRVARKALMDLPMPDQYSQAKIKTGFSSARFSAWTGWALFNIGRFVSVAKLGEDHKRSQVSEQKSENIALQNYALFVSYKL